LHDALVGRLSATRVESYTVNARIRPLLLFWIGRTGVGEATVTWRRGGAGHTAYEFLIGSNPARAPRGINRWGFLVEEHDGDRTDVLGIMRESGEQTLEEARASVDREDTVSTFKAVRTTVVGTQSVSGLITMQAPSSLTYRDVQQVVVLVPAEAPTRTTIQIPAGTRTGFLLALDTLIQSSIEPCRRGAAKDVTPIRYLYNQDLFGLSLESCEVQPASEAGAQTLADEVEGRFRLMNLRTKYSTTFRIVFGTAGDLRGIPVRMTFRPRWWMEVELERTRSPASRLTSAAPQGRSGDRP
jgi:hypothetical protein